VARNAIPATSDSAAASSRFCPAERAGVESVVLVGAQPAAEHEFALGVEVLGDLRHPVVAARLVVLWEICTDRRTLVAALPDSGTHVAGLAAEVARGAVRIVAIVPSQEGGVPRALDRSRLEFGRQRCVVGDSGCHELAGLVLAERTLDDAVLIREVVECGLPSDRSSRDATRDDRLSRRLRAVVVGEIADDGVRDVVARTAVVDRAMELRLQELMRGVGIIVRPSFAFPPESTYIPLP
jgi:hypothetical protein